MRDITSRMEVVFGVGELNSLDASLLYELKQNLQIQIKDKNVIL